MPIGNESVPKIIINDTINLFFKTAINILVISNHNSFRVLFDKIATVYIIRKIHLGLYLSIGNGRPMEHALCGANGIGTLSLLGRETVTGLKKT